MNNSGVISSTASYSSFMQALGKLFLLFVFGIIVHIKYILYIIGATLVVNGYGTDSDLFTGILDAQNIYIGLIYYLVFMVGSMAGLGGQFGCRSEYKENIDMVYAVAGCALLFVVMAFDVNALMASLIVISLYGASRKGNFTLLYVIILAIILASGVLSEIRDDSYLPSVWVVFFILGVVSYKNNILRLRFVIFFPFVVLVALYIYLEKYNSNGLLIRLAEQAAPASWGNASFVPSSYFDANETLSGAPLHRSILMANGNWGPQFQLSYLFRMEGIVFLPFYFLTSYVFGACLRLLLLSFNAHSAFRAVLLMYCLVYLATGPLTEKPQYPSLVFIILVAAIIFETLIKAIFRHRVAD
jgi:hypothetical protein